MGAQAGFEGWVYLTILMPPYLISILIVYYHAESRGESGLYWALFCAVFPGLGVLIYLTWGILKYIRGRKPAVERDPKRETPDMALSRDRLRGGTKVFMHSHFELDDLIQQGRWNDAEEEAKRILEEAEQIQDGPTIASMIGYLERINKRRRI